MELAGIVLAGGAARRLGGVDKPLLTVDGVPLLHRVVSALRGHGAAPVIVVGPARPDAAVPPDVLRTREDPPGTGPVAALAAGLALVDTPLVATLAADLTGVRTATLARLAEALHRAPAADGAVLTDDTGHRQWLLAVWRTPALRRALPPDPRGVSLRSCLGPLATVDVPALPGEAHDVDAPGDLTGR